MYELACPHCGRAVRFARKVTVPVDARCPHCGRSFRVVPGGAVGTAQPVRNFARERARQPVAVPPLLWVVGGGLVVLSLLLAGVALVLRRPVTVGSEEGAGRAAPQQPAEAHGVAEAAPKADAEMADNNEEADQIWPPLDREHFPGLPAELGPVVPPKKLRWSLVPGASYLYAGTIESSAKLSPIDLGRAARQVLQFVDRKEFQIELRCERKDANTFLVQCRLTRLRGSMRGPTGRLEYDSRDGIGFLPANEPLAKLVGRTWLVRCSAKGAVLRLEWHDGTVIDGPLREAVRQVTPIHPVPDPVPAVGHEVVEVDDGVQRRTRLLGADRHGWLVFVAIEQNPAGSGDGPTRKVLAFDADAGILRSVHVSDRRTRGTGLPRVGRFRPTLQTVTQITFLR